MVDLAKSKNPLQTRQAIATRQGIPLDYMGQLTSKLKDANLLATGRGCRGGLQLAKKASEISLWDIFMALEDSLHPVSCLDDNLKSCCKHQNDCLSEPIWQDIYGHFSGYLKEKYLSHF